MSTIWQDHSVMRKNTINYCVKATKSSNRLTRSWKIEIGIGEMLITLTRLPD